MKYRQRLIISLLLVLNLIRIVTACSPSATENRSYAGRSVSDWHERLKDIDPKSLLAVSVVDPLLEIVMDDNLPGVDREPFAAYLARIGRPARRVVPVLASLISRRDTSKRDYLWAARALALMGEHARDATPELVSFLFDDNIPVRDRQSAAEALGLIGPAHPDAIPALLQLLQYRAASATSESDAAFMRHLGAESIFLVGPDAEVAAPLLMRLVRNQNESEALRRSAIAALGALEPRGTIAIAALSEELISGASPALRDEAAKALVSVGRNTMDATIRFLENPDPEVRWRIAHYLGDPNLGQTRTDPTKELVRLFTDVDARVRIAAAETVHKLNGRSDDLILVAIHLLTARSRDVRFRAKRLLLDLQPLDEKHLLVLVHLRSHSSAREAAGISATLKQLRRKSS